MDILEDSDASGQVPYGPHLIVPGNCLGDRRPGSPIPRTARPPFRTSRVRQGPKTFPRQEERLQSLHAHPILDGTSYSPFSITSNHITFSSRAKYRALRTNAQITLTSDQLNSPPGRTRSLPRHWLSPTPLRPRSLLSAQRAFRRSPAY